MQEVFSTTSGTANKPSGPQVNVLLTTGSIIGASTNGAPVEPLPETVMQAEGLILQTQVEEQPQRAISES
jgi:hypothetical protein